MLNMGCVWLQAELGHGQLVDAAFLPWLFCSSVHCMLQMIACRILEHSVVL
jgi:hypothetical protein